MGISPETFKAMTPAEFICAWCGWSNIEHSRAKQMWEQTRWAVWVLTSTQLDRKDRLPMTQMFPLPWEEAQPHLLENISMQERIKRINAIKKSLCRNALRE